MTLASISRANNLVGVSNWGATHEKFYGIIDDLSVYNIALNATQISCHKGTPCDFPCSTCINILKVCSTC